MLLMTPAALPADGLGQVLDHAPLLVFIKDLHGRYLFVNRRYEEHFGRSRADILGRHPTDFYGARQADALLANDSLVVQSGKPLHFEEVIPRADGTRTYQCVKFPLVNGEGEAYAVAGFSSEVTDARRTEEALRDSEALYHSLVESLPLCIFRKDITGRFTFGNRPFCDELCRPLDRIVGRTDRDFYPEELAVKYIKDDQRVLLTGESFEDVEEHTKVEGERSYVQVLKVPLHDARGKVVGLQGVFWDITARKRAELELGRTAAEFRVARRIQQQLFPTAVPRAAGLDIGGASFGFDIGGASYPAEAIGGDYYDYLPLADGGVGIAIGDVSGHGVGPALLMAETRALLRAFTRTQSDVGVVLELANRLLVEDIEGDRFVTLLLARLDPARRALVYASAGHPSGYVLDAEGKVKHVLESTSIPLGVMVEAEFPTGPEVALAPGDLVVFMTDGVLEARSPDGQPFGAQRALDLVRVYRSAPARQIVEDLYHAVRAYTRNQPQYDDITATVVKVEAGSDRNGTLSHGGVA